MVNTIFTEVHQDNAGFSICFAAESRVP